MARKRVLKPGFFTNEELGDLDPYTRLLFAGLWLIADREGRLKDQPRRIKLEILPFDDVDVDGMLGDLAEAGFIIRYAVEGVRYVQITNFLLHQTPHHTEEQSRIPPPADHEESTARTRGVVGTDKEASTPKEGVDIESEIGGDDGNDISPINRSSRYQKQMPMPREARSSSPSEPVSQEDRGAQDLRELVEEMVDRLPDRFRRRLTAEERDGFGDIAELYDRAQVIAAAKVIRGRPGLLPFAGTMRETLQELYPEVEAATRKAAADEWHPRIENWGDLPAEVTP